ncbi:FimV/HubP family polar landmark protein [Microbulbifer sp. SAOS-129_SWC]|uniref:FimV/HubP family polar landmark protein n=1 Tax=Microbulbifer sp. SAOS-129_SWC TaxID=3145235 RepID=UPI0032180231
MRVRKLALAVGLVSALGGNGALALGLGEIKLNSTLNQPLDAEIGLLQTRGLSEGEIKVRLATPDDFDRAGVDRSYLLSELKFEVDFSGNQPVVRITSREPIREPYLDFLVETRWPSGRLLREYTLLMDLPAFSGETARQPVRAAERERQQVQRQPQPQRQPQQRPLQPTTTPAAKPAQQAAAKPAAQAVAEEPAVQQRAAQDTADSGSQVYGPVSSNDTLWEIAQQSRVGHEFSVQQTMLAIQRLNPEAFINNNINLLKKGAVLRLPNTDDVRALSVRDAISEVAVQNDSWRQRAGQDTTTGAPLDARTATADSTESDTVEGRVSLAAPGDNDTVTSGSGSGAADSEAHSGELAATEEELDKSKLENSELKDRISELDDQIDTMEKMVDVSSDELKAVQDAAKQSNDAADAEPSADSSLAAADTEQADTAAQDDSAEQGDKDTAAAAETVKKPAAQEQHNRVVTVQTKPEPTLLERVMDNIMFIGIGAAALLAGLFGLFAWRRRKEEEEAMRIVEAEMAAERALAEAPAESEEDEALAAVESMEASDEFDLGELDGVGTDDPVSEAEIHLSLGQYSEAEGKLLTGLQQDGQNVDARLMLLEVYAHQQDADKFDDHYRQLLTISDGPAADRAARLRESIAGARAFEAPEMDFTSESLEAAQLDDISASFEDDFSSFDSSADSTHAQDSSLLDDLTMDLDGDSAVPNVEDAAVPSADDDEFSLDLEVDFDSGASDFGGDTLGSSEADTSEDAADTAGDEFNFDELMSADLDLGELDLDTGDTGSGAADTASAADSSDLGEFELDGGDLQLDSDDTGLEFDLDLSPMDEDDAQGAATEAPSPQVAEPTPAVADNATFDAAPADDADSDDFESFGDDLGELDLDSIDLDEIAGDLGAADELAADSDMAVTAPAEKASTGTAAQPAAASSADSDFGDLNFNLESDLDSELNLLEGSDEVSTKLELAQAYLDMGDKDGAKDILKEVVDESSGEHQGRAKEMLERMV